MAADTQIVSSAIRAGKSDYPLPESLAFRLKAVNATFTDNGAGQSYLPGVVLISDSGHVIAHAVDTDVSVAAGGTAETSFFPGVRRRLTGTGLTLDYSLGEIGSNIETTFQNQVTVTTTYQNVSAGDGILVLCAAPSLPTALGVVGHPFSVDDDPGNVYTALASFAFEANPPNVNEGIYATLFWCPASVAEMVVGVDRFFAIWDSHVYDACASVWTVRHSGGAHTPTVLAATADHDAATFAAGQVTLTAPNYTPTRSKALEFAIVMTAKSGGVGGFGGVGGWSGFFQAEGRLSIGSKQQYLRNPQTHGADAYLIAGAVANPYEDDVGVLPAGVLVPAFNGVAQLYSAGTNAWKGIILLGLD